MKGKVDLTKVEKEYPICDKCDIELDFDCNESDFEKYGISEFESNGWFQCPKCREISLIKNYTQETKREIRERISKLLKFRMGIFWNTIGWMFLLVGDDRGWNKRAEQFLKEKK